MSIAHLAELVGMGAIANNYGLETAVTLAINAGADILAFALNSAIFDPTIPGRVFEHIKGLVESGEIKESRIDQSYRRISQLKARIPAT